MKIASAGDVGRIVRQKRKSDGLTLEEAAAVCGVSCAFLSALENGKVTARFGEVLQVFDCQGRGSPPGCIEGATNVCAVRGPQ